MFLPNRHFDVRLTRGEFEDMIRAQIESTIGALTRTLRSARVEPADLSAVLLVGGSSRIPLVAQMITAALDRPTLVDAHPKYAVALGAATLAAELGAPDARADGGARRHGPARRPRRRAAASAPPRRLPRPHRRRPAEPADAAPVGALAPAAAFGAGWIGGRAPDGGPATAPFGSVDTPGRARAARDRRAVPGEPPYPGRSRPPRRTTVGAGERPRRMVPAATVDAGCRLPRHAAAPAAGPAAPDRPARRGVAR